MSDKFYEAIGHEMTRRMRNWARWWDASEEGVLPSSLGSLAVELGTRLDPSYGEVEPPLLFGDGADTEAGLKELPERYQQVVRKFWLNEGKGLRWNARQRRIDDHTVLVWLIEGHAQLRRALNARTRAAAARRAAHKDMHAGA